MKKHPKAPNGTEAQANPSPRPSRPGPKKSRTFPSSASAPRPAGWKPWSSSWGTCRRTAAWPLSIVQHLDPTHKGIMPELLQRATAMQVIQVKDRTQGPAQPRLRDPAQQGHVHPSRRAAPARPGGAARAAAADRLLLPFPGRGPAGASIGVILSGMGTDGTLGLRAIKEKAGRGLRAGAGLGQVRRHAHERHRRRAGRHRGPGRRSCPARSSPISSTLPSSPKPSVPLDEQGPERHGKGRHPPARPDRPRLFAVQEKHRVPADRAAHGHPPDRQDRRLCPLSCRRTRRSWNCSSRNC